MRAAGDVRARGADVPAEQLGRQQDAGVALDALPLERVVRIARPEAVHAGHDPQVDAPAARGARLDRHLGEPLAQRIEQGVERAGVRRRGARHVVAVVIPLEEPDGVLLEQRAERREQVGRGLRLREVERVLEPPGGRHRRVGRREHPLGMLRRQPRFRAHHLGLDPQPEVHAARGHALRERVQAVGPPLGVHRPVAQRAPVVAAAGEPAVIEHEPLDPEVARRVDERSDRVERLLEVHGLPGVEHDGPRGRRADAAHVGVQPVGEAVEPRDRVHEHRLGRRVRLAGGERDLARIEQLGRDEAAVAGRQRLDARRAVAAPGVVQGPDLAAAEPEAGRARDREEGGVVAGAAVPLLAQVHAVAHGAAPGPALARPEAGEVEQLARAAGDAHGGGEAVQVDAQLRREVVRRRRVEPDRHDALGAERQAPADRQERAVVVLRLEVRRHGEGVAVETGQPDARGQTRGGHPAAARHERGKTRPPLGGAREHGGGEGDVGGAGRDRGGGPRHIGELGFAHRAEVGPPVEEPRHGRAAGVEQNADTRGTEVVKRNSYSWTGIAWAWSAAMVASWPASSASMSVPSPESAAEKPSATSL